MVLALVVSVLALPAAAQDSAIPDPIDGADLEPGDVLPGIDRPTDLLDLFQGRARTNTSGVLANGNRVYCSEDRELGSRAHILGPDPIVELPLPDGWSCSPEAFASGPNGEVYVPILSGAPPNASAVAAFAPDGSFEWLSETAQLGPFGARGLLVAADGMLYARAGTSLIALDPADGSVADDWTVEIENSIFSTSEAMFPHQRRIGIRGTNEVVYLEDDGELTSVDLPDGIRVGTSNGSTLIAVTDRQGSRFQTCDQDVLWITPDGVQQSITVEAPARFEACGRWSIAAHPDGGASGVVQEYRDADTATPFRRDWFVFRLDAIGDLVWSQTIERDHTVSGQIGVAQPWDVIVDDLGQTIITSSLNLSCETTPAFLVFCTRFLLGTYGPGGQRTEYTVADTNTGTDLLGTVEVHDGVATVQLETSWPAVLDGTPHIATFNVLAIDGLGTDHEIGQRRTAALRDRPSDNSPTPPPEGPRQDDPSPEQPDPAEQAPPAQSPGYWMVDAGGQIYGFGDAAAPGSVPGRAVAATSTPLGEGLWVLTDDGVVHALDGAAHHGDVDMSALTAGEMPATISVLPDGSGYWVFTNKGRAIDFGAAGELEDLVALGLSESLNGPVLASVATPTGEGAYMIASDGGVFALGDAMFQGSMGGRFLNEPVIGVAPDPDGTGYWLVARDGGIFAFEAEFLGSVPGELAPGVRLNAPVVGAVPFGGGYLMVASDGGVFNFSDQEFLGSLGEDPPASPVTAIVGYPA
ncbi:MAG: hypothetical protein AAFZ07_23340 [Actinomycetota bacterium]